MQQLASRPRPDQRANNGGAPRSQVILIVALLLFSVAGLASGFSFGALTGKHQQVAQPTQITNVAPSLKGQGTTPTPKPKVQIITLGCPSVLPGSSIYLGSQVPDGTNTYTFVAQAVDTTGNQPGKGIYCTQANQPIHAAGITFKLWITKHVANGKNLQFPDKADVLMQPEQLVQPLDGKADGKNYQELQNNLQFDTPQVQQSNNQGQVTWNYKINPALKDGMYTLVVLADWQGKTSNWTWRDLVVKKQG